MYLLVGGDSEIGAATYLAMKAQGYAVMATTRHPECVAHDRPFLDLSAPLDSWEPPRRMRSACICAAVARPADCASDPVGTAHINVVQTLALAEKLLSRDVHVLFLSSNQVFDGRVPHVPADATCSPVSEYGCQKARTEVALRARMAPGAPVAILRLAKVVTSNMALIRGWVEALTAGKAIRCFYDMALAPVPINLVCAAIIALMSDQARGIFQLTGPADVTYAGVARFLADRLGADPSLVSETSAREANLPSGMTPRYTTLDSSVLQKRYGIFVPQMGAVIEQVMEKILAPARARPG
jgi:dTDP-4-dehydrorhamnose reductase